MKKIAAILALTLALAVTAQAQIFIEEGEATSRSSYSTEDIGIIPIHQAENDQANYVPLGGGLLIMTALGGLYLADKRKKEEK